MHIIPAAGSATRIGGIPKYLLPLGPSGKPLLRYHIEMALFSEIEVCVIVNPKLFDYVSELLSKWDSASVQLISAHTSTMTETVRIALNSQEHVPPVVSVSMPDAFVSQMLDKDFSALRQARDLENCLILWKIRREQKGKLGQVSFSCDKKTVNSIIDKDPNCNFEYAWGMFAIRSELAMSFPIIDPHPGISISNLIGKGLALNYISQTGEYWDCGTPKEYLTALQMSLSGEKN